MRLYAIAMESEAKDIIKNYEKVTNLAYPLYKKNNNLVAITNIGKVNAAFVLSDVCSKYDVSEIINLGFVGAFGDFKVGDNVLVKQAIYHDFDLTMFGYKHGYVPNIKDPFLPNESHFNLFKNKFNQATLYTGDSFQTESVATNYIADMEGTALFQVAYLLQIPILSIKVVSDIIEGESHIETYESFEKVGSQNIFDLYLKIEGVLNEKRINVNQ